MLDIEDFQKIRKNVFEYQNRLHDIISDENYFSDLKIVCANEKSSEVTNLLRTIIDELKEKFDTNCLFTIYWLYYLQTYYYDFTENEEEVKSQIKEMEKIALSTKNVEHQANVLTAKALFNQLKRNNQKARDQLTEAEQILKPFKKNYPESYYALLYAHTFYLSLSDKDYKSAIRNMKKCFDYYYLESKNSSGMIKSLTLLLNYYIFLNQKKKTEDLLKWVFQKEKIQDKITSSQAILLYWCAGTISAIDHKIEHTISYLKNSYEKIKYEGLQKELMYEYTYTLRLLSRYYAFQGKFQESYELLVELVNFMEDDYVKFNYIQKNRKKVYFGSYFTLLFIFVQLDLDIDNIQDNSLKKLYNYTKRTLSKKRISQKLLLNETTDNKQLSELLDDEIHESKDDVYLVLHQLLITHDSYTTSEIVIEDKISSLRDYVYDPHYLDILLAKIYLSKGNYQKFDEILRNFTKETARSKEPILSIWKDIFSLLSKYINDPSDATIAVELSKLEEMCRNKTFNKIAEEINFYQKLVASKKTISSFTDKFRHTAFMDIFNEESKRMVLDSI